MANNDTDGGGMYYGGRSRIACNCGEEDNLKIAVNESTREIIIGCPECRKDILKAAILWTEHERR